MDVAALLLLLAATASCTLAADDPRRKRTLYGNLCPKGCTSCSNSNGCVTCKPRYFLYLRRTGMRQTGVCVLSCPLGHFGARNRDFNYCAKCKVDSCEICVNKNYCTRCAEGHVEYRGKCTEGCPNGTYGINQSRQCLPKDCVVDEWSSWGVCAKNGQTCGYKYGVQTRMREIVQLPSAAGALCPETTENRRCRLAHRICPSVVTNDSDFQKSEKQRRRKQRRKERKKARGWKKNPERKRKRNRKGDSGSNNTMEMSNQLQALLV